MKKEAQKNELKGYKGLRQTFRYYKKYKGHVVAFALLIVLSMIPTIFMPIFEGNMMGYFTQFVVGGDAWKPILICAGSVCALGLLNTVIYFFTNKIYIRFSKKVRVDIQRDLLNEISTLEVQNFDKTSTGVFISRINDDVGEMSNFFMLLVDNVLTILTSIIILGYVAFINIYIFLFLVAQLIIIYIVQAQRTKVWYKRRNEWKKHNDEIVGLRSEAIRGARDIKCLNLAKIFNGRTIDRQIKLSTLDEKNQIVDQAWMRGVRITSITLNFLYIVLGVFLLMYTNFTIASFFIVLNYRGRINNISDIVSTLKQSAARAELSSKRVFELMHDNPAFPHEKFGDIALPSVEGRIEFKDVSFAYHEDAAPVFTNLSFTIHPNQITAFVGKSGGGKSSILSLIEKFYPLSNGEILLDGFKISTLTKDTLRDNVSLVLQSPYIFNMSIRENLLL